MVGNMVMCAKSSRSQLRQLVLLTLVLVPLTVQCSAGLKGIERASGTDGGLHYGMTKRQCNGLAMPHGWIWIASETNTLAGCGDYPRNVALIRYVEGAPAGTTERVCTGSPLPPGWSVIGHETEENRCDSDYPGNVAIIQR